MAIEPKAFQKLLLQIKKNHHSGSDIINLTSRGIRSTHARALAEALLHSNYYKTVLLGDNEIDDEGGFALAQLIAENRSLTELDASFNYLTDRAMTQILTAIKSSSSLQVFSMMGNGCSAELEHEIQGVLSDRREKTGAGSPLSTSPTATTPISDGSSPSSNRLTKTESKRKGLRGAFGLGALKGLGVSFSTTGIPTSPPSSPSSEDVHNHQGITTSQSTPDLVGFLAYGPPASGSGSPILPDQQHHPQQQSPPGERGGHHALMSIEASNSPKKSPGTFSQIFPRFKSPRSPRKETNPDTKATTKQIFLAVAENDTKALTEFLRRKVNIQCTDRNGRRPIHLAVTRKATEALRLLLESGVDPDGRDRWGDTPLHWAAFKGDLQSLSILLEFGANFSLFSTTGIYPLHAAVRGGSPKCVEKLLEQGAAPDAKNDKGFTPLHLSVLQDRADIVHILLKFGAKVSALDSCRRSVLHWACFRDSANLCRTLIENDSSTVNTPDVSGLTPIHYAILSGSVSCVKLMKEQNASPTVPDRNGKTPVHYAAFQGDVSILDVLLKDNSSKSVVDVKDRWNETPLHWAIVRGHISMASRLMTAGADIHATNRFGETVLHMLARLPEGQQPVALNMRTNRPTGYLMGSPPGYIKKPPSAPSSTVPTVVLEEQMQMSVGSHGSTSAPSSNSPLRTRSVQATFYANPSKLQAIAGKMRTIDTQQLFRSQLESTLRFVLSHFRPSDLDAVNEKGETAIHVAAEVGNEVVVSLLLADHAQSSLLNQSGVAPIHLAAGSGMLSCLNILISSLPPKGIDIPTSKGETAIHFAAASGQLRALELLIHAKANVTAVDKQGKSALHKVKNVECGALLLTHNCPIAPSLSGVTLLDSASTLGNVAVGVWLLAQNKASLPSEFLSLSPVIESQTPGAHLLHLAAAQGNPQLISSLVEKGFPVDCKTSKGLTPLAIAAALGNVAAATVLVEKGARVTQEIVQLAVKTENLAVSDILRPLLPVVPNRPSRSSTTSVVLSALPPRQHSRPEMAISPLI